MRKTLLLFKSLLMSVCAFTLTVQAQSLSDVTNINVGECYIYDSFLSADWGNESMAPGNGSTANDYWAKSWITGTRKVYKGSEVANIGGTELEYIVKQVRPGNYNSSIGMLNMKNLYRADASEAFKESHITSSLTLPELPSVGKIALFLLKPYKSGVSDGIALDKKNTDGSWTEVIQVEHPSADGWVYLHYIDKEAIISQVPVTYRIRSYSYNSRTAEGYGPILGGLIVQKYLENDNYSKPLTRPYYPLGNNSSTLSNAQKLVDTYTEAEWLGLVPTQAPRSLQHSPASVNSTDWTWDPARPDQITCKATGTVFPNSNYTVLYADAEVMTGKIIKVPYYKTSKGNTYVQAQIDYGKTAFMTKNLPILGAAYQLTKDEKYARYVALALDKWANAVPDFFMTEGWNKDRIVNKSELSKYPNVQRASDHNGLTHEFHEGELLSFDRIYESQALKDLSAERGYDVRRHVIDDLFLNIGLWVIDQPMSTHQSTNLVGHIGVLIQVAAIIEDEAMKEKIIDFVDRYYTLCIANNFKRDGMYPESFSYHRGYADENYANVKLLEDYFSMFEPETDAMRRIAAKSVTRKEFTQRTTLVHKQVGFPNGDMAPFDDTTAGYSDKRTSTKSFLLPAYYHAMLGAGTGDQQIQSNIGANDKANHVGHSVMSMTLYANGEEQIGDIRYSRLPGRDYTNSVTAHNLVAVDEELTQYFTSARQVLGNSGHVFTNGYFTLFEPGIDGVAATEVYSKTIRPGKVERYQRIHVLNTIDPSRPYLLDLFVVKGGTKHDYLLHGSTQYDQTSETSLSMTKINSQYPLLPTGVTYKDPVVEADKTNWYGAFREMSKAQSPGEWSVTYVQDASRGVKIFAVDDARSTVYLGKSPNSYRRATGTTMYEYWRPALVERRTGNSGMRSLFTHVMEAYNGGSKIVSVKQVPLNQNSEEYVGVSVTFTDGREDVILVNLNNALITGIDPAEKISTADGRYAMEGKIAVFSKSKDAEKAKNILINGSRLSVGEELAEIENYKYSGTITSTVRKEDGASCNAFVTDVMIPVGDELKGRWMSVKFGSYKVINPPSGAVKTQEDMNELFQIDHVEQVGGQTYIVTVEDHCLKVGGAMAEEIMRPQRQFTGATTFTILKSQSGLFEGGTGLSAVSVEKNVQIYPNPVKDVLHVRADQEIKRVIIYSLTGFAVRELLFAGQTEVTVQAMDLAEGNYIVTIELQDGSVKNERLMIAR